MCELHRIILHADSSKSGVHQLSWSVVHVRCRRDFPFVSFVFIPAFAQKFSLQEENLFAF